MTGHNSKFTDVEYECAGNHQGSQLVCYQRQIVWSGMLLPKFADSFSERRRIFILHGKLMALGGYCLASMKRKKSVSRLCLIFLCRPP